MRLNDLKNIVKSDKYKVISFDIFDTLLVRPCLEPTDMFKIVGSRCGFGNEFIEYRKISERLARESKAYYEDDITIDDIYEKLEQNFNIDSNICKKLKETEIIVEKEYLYPKYSMREVFLEAKKANKIIIICSDMYLSKETLNDILIKNGYSGFKDLFVSSDLKLSKGTGRLFDYVKKVYSSKGVAPGEILHIGDNHNADVIRPKAKGLDAIRIVNSRDRFKMIIGLNAIQYFDVTFTDNRFIVGYIINKIFDDPCRPFDLKTLFNGEINIFTDLIFTPILYTFSRWMIEDCKKNNIKVLYLVYRDGYLIDKIINIIKKQYNDVPTISKLRLSRKVLYPFESLDKNGFMNNLISHRVNADLTIREFYNLRVLDNNFSGKNCDNKIGEYIEQIKFSKFVENDFIKNSKKYIKGVELYFNDVLKERECTAVFDIGYSGRIVRFLNNRFNIKTIGYHLFGDMNLKYDELIINSYFNYSSTCTQKLYKIHNQIFEDILCEPEGSIESIEGNDDGSYLMHFDSNYTKNSTLICCQERILNNIREINEILKNDIKYLKFNGYDFYNILKSFLNNSNDKDVSLFKGWVFKDNFIRGDNVTGVNLYDRLSKNKINIATLSENINNKNFYKENIKRILKQIGMFNIAKSYYNYIKKFYNSLTCNNNNFICDYCDNELKKIEAWKYDSANNILFVGHFASFDKGVCNYINKISENSTKKFMVVSTAPKMDTFKVFSKVKLNNIVIPTVFFPNGYHKFVDCKISGETKKYIEKYSYLYNIVDRVKLQFGDMGKYYPELIAVFLDRYFSVILEKTKPEKVIIWNKFNATHDIFFNVCRKMNIPVVFAEFGVLPGTINFDTKGQMGESAVAYNFEEFNKLKITNSDIDHSRKVQDYIFKNKLNRNIQPINNNVINCKNKLNRNRPTICFIGQSDFEAGLVPYNNYAKKYHSPWCSSSIEGYTYLAKIAKCNNWNLIFKPHPALYYDDLLQGNDNIIVNDCNLHELIDISDVVVTIASQVSYEALLRKKPVVMIGYNQLKGKGCAYEAYNKDDLEKVISNALIYGITEEMQMNFDTHVARLLKYYLYNDYVKRNFYYGKDINEVIRYLDKES